MRAISGRWVIDHFCLSFRKARREIARRAPETVSYSVQDLSVDHSRKPALRLILTTEATVVKEAHARVNGIFSLIISIGCFPASAARLLVRLPRVVGLRGLRGQRRQ